MNCRILVALFLSFCSWHMCLAYMPITTLEILGDPVPFGGWVGYAAWCTDCRHLAVVGEVDFCGAVRAYEFDPAATEPLTLISSVTTASVSWFNATSWCGDCEYLAAVGEDHDFKAFVKVYKFTTTLEEVTSATTSAIGTYYSVDWCSGCGYLAASGYDGSGALLQLYAFNSTASTLSEVISVTDSGNYYFAAVAWCDDCNYLATIRQPQLYSSPECYIDIYAFDSTTSALELVKEEHLTNSLYSLAWCDGCNYLATAGFNASSEGLAQVYSFNTSTSAFTLLDEQTITATSRFYSVDWCGNCSYLVAGGYNANNESIAQVYSFNTESNSLTPVTSDTIAASWFNSTVWCNGCRYLAGGYNTDYFNGYIQLYRSGYTIITAPTVYSQKSSYRLPTQLDITNKLCWNTVPDAVAYNVYADVYRSVQLAHITVAPYCYLHHHIIPNIQNTYYVTAVDADGNESAATIVMI